MEIQETSGNKFTGVKSSHGIGSLCQLFVLAKARLTEKKTSSMKDDRNKHSFLSSTTKIYSSILLKKSGQSKKNAKIK